MTIVNFPQTLTPPRILSCEGGNALVLDTTARIDGTNFLQGQTFSTISYGTGTSALTVSMGLPGRGEVYGLTLTIVDAVASSVSMSGSDIVVHYRGATHANADKADTVRDLINNDPNANQYIFATAGGHGNLAALAQTPFTGGKGEGTIIFLGSFGQTATLDTSDTTIIFNPVSDKSTGDIVALRIIANGVESNTLSVQIG